MIADSWHSYPSIYALGHRCLDELLLDPVIIEEKVDGSQFSFGRFGGELRCRSKGQQLNIEAPEKMFERAVEVAASLDLCDGWTYRAEYLQKPKHNSLTYSRTPDNNLIVFDINNGHESYLGATEKAEEATRLGLEVVPLLFCGVVKDIGLFNELLDRESQLGGPKIEGVVCKNYARFGPDKKALMGKYVSEAFKEIHTKEWKESNPAAGDIVERMMLMYRSEARWHKAVQHLREVGALGGEPRDIPALFKEVNLDILKECEGEIKDALFKWAWPRISRAATRGLPEWYKQELLKNQSVSE